MSDLPSILFVCMGNICRSPAAEGLFADYVNKNDALEIKIDSAGTHNYNLGRPADPRMMQAALRRGCQLKSRARLVHENDLQSFDWVLAMDRENLLIIESLGNRRKEPARATVQLLSHFLDDSWPTDVPDPYFGGDDGFEYVLDMIEAACPVILEAILNSDR